MDKKTLFFSLGLFLASDAALGSNFYIGADIGGIALQNKLSTVEGSFERGKFGFIGGGFAGYTYKSMSQWNLGLEGFIDGVSVRITDQTSTNTTQAKDRYNGGIRLLPGYQFLPNNEAHLLVGFVRGNFNFSDSDHNANSNYGTNGFQLGIGSSIVIINNFSVRGDVIYSGYQSHTIIANSDAHKNQFSSWAGTLSAVYAFS